MLYLRRVRRLDGLRLMGKPIDELFPEPKTAEELAFTYVDALTQVCFTERVIRSTVLWNGSRSWSVEPK